MAEPAVVKFMSLYHTRFLKNCLNRLCNKEYEPHVAHMALHHIGCLCSEHNAVLQNKLLSGRAKCLVPTGDTKVYPCVKMQLD